VVSKRDHEVHAVSLLAMALSQQNKRGYLIGLQLLGHKKPSLRLCDLFDPKRGLDRDVDIVLAPVQDAIVNEHLVHPVQIIRCLDSASLDTDVSTLRIIGSLKRKLRSSKDDKLILLIHLERAGRIDYFKLHAALTAHNCPFGQVFVVGQYAPAGTHRWFCVQVFPTAQKLDDLDFTLLDKQVVGHRGQSRKTLN